MFGIRVQMRNYVRVTEIFLNIRGKDHGRLKLLVYVVFLPEFISIIPEVHHSDSSGICII